MSDQAVSILSSKAIDASVAGCTRRKIFRRLLPFLFVLYIISYLDRANVAFAKLPMSADLGFSEAVFGFGAGIFYLGYILLEIPGALIVEKWSARIWMARIMISWGLCTVLVGFVHTANQFYIARCLLGVAEGGFFPGIVVYLAHWFAKEDRSRAMAGFTMAAPAAIVIGAPISALILQLDWLGWAGWRWMFVLEGLPAVFLGIVTAFFLTDRPHQAKWLEPEERDWIAARLASERQELHKSGHMTVLQGLKQRNILFLALACALCNFSMFAYLLWLPTTIRDASGLSVTLSTICSALPFGLAMISIPLVARSSDRTGKRKLHTIVPMVLAAVFFVLSAIPGLPFPLVLALLCLTGAAAFSWGVSLWVIPGLILGESAAAASVGFINSINSIGSFLGPAVTGFLLTQGFSHREVVWLLSSCFVVSAGLVAAVRPKPGVVL
ncbi:MAG: MFS transporter [Acidimicrobiia bacterium]|nr:MFS transporter [Acidimicrobiia bacterium]